MVRTLAFSSVLEYNMHKKPYLLQPKIMRFATEAKLPQIPEKNVLYVPNFSDFPEKSRTGLRNRNRAAIPSFLTAFSGTSGKIFAGPALRLYADRGLRQIMGHACFLWKFRGREKLFPQIGMTENSGTAEHFR